MPNDISKIQLPDGITYNVTDKTSGYVTINDVPAISVNTSTKTLVINTAVDNGDEVDY